jgi:hypothetical protein
VIVPRIVSLIAVTALLLLAGNSPRLIYSRAFPGSTPEYFKISIDSAGTFEYSEAIVDNKPLQAHLNEADTAQLFDMAAKLDFFKTPLESGLKVANTGKKIFRYEGADGQSSETTFNYSLNDVAQKLLDKLEQIAATERAYIDLDRTVHFDKLGVNDALAEIEGLWLRKQLAAPDQFIPLLTRIATHDSFMHLARDRAARLKDEFSKPVSTVGDATAAKSK